MIRPVALCLGLLLSAACQHQTADPVPAVLADGSDTTLTALKGLLATALGRSNISLSGGDLTETSRFAVPPPPPGPLETRSTATPVQFELMIYAGTCFAVRADNDERIALDGVPCRPA